MKLYIGVFFIKNVYLLFITRINHFISYFETNNLRDDTRR